jgi:glycerophosphoryl diester phosphodiesterase
MPALSPETSRPRRVGHKGADLIEPGNTRASFDAALDVGVDMIEFDVLSEELDGSGRLLMAHDYGHLDAEHVLTLEEGLMHLAGAGFAGVTFDVDLKLRGYELRVLDALRVAGLVERSLISSTFPQSLDLLRAAEPALRLGWSIPRARRDYTARPLTILPALVVLGAYRRRLPSRAHRALRSGRFDAIMAHWRLVTPNLVRAVREAGGELYVWTVDDALLIQRLTRLGVDAIITNDPRLFRAAEVCAQEMMQVEAE